jgi:hypothetical protein
VRRGRERASVEKAVVGVRISKSVKGVFSTSNMNIGAPASLNPPDACMEVSVSLLDKLKDPSLSSE